MKFGNSSRTLTTKLSVMALAIGVVLMVASSAWAQAPTKEACIESHDQVQRLRKGNRFLDARREARTCAQDACPSVIKTECLTFLRLLEEDLPTLSFRVRDAEGNDVFDVEVHVDGVLLAKALDGTSFEVDPGKRALRFAAKDFQPVERFIVVRQGEKNQSVDIELARIGASTTPVADDTVYPPPQPLPGPEPIPEESDSSSMAPWIVGGVGLGVALVGGILVASAFGDTGDLDACSPTCPDDEVDPVRTRMIAGDVMIGAGLATVGVAVILLLIGDGGDTEQALLQASPSGTSLTLTF